jgi:cell division control protein 45
VESSTKVCVAPVLVLNHVTYNFTLNAPSRPKARPPLSLHGEQSFAFTSYRTMYLPRNLISYLYTHLTRTHHALSPPVLLLVSLDPDALCACRILTALFKRDYIPHKIQPISGYGDLARAGEQLVRPMRTSEGGSGGVVVCLGVGGLVDLEAMLGLEVDEDGQGGMGHVEVWVIDARRPWNLSNVFGMQSLNSASQEGQLAPLVDGVSQGKISDRYRPGRGGIVVFDDGDIEDELGAERDAYCALAEMPELGEEDLDESEDEADGSEAEDEERIPDSAQQPGQKRKSPSREDEDSESEADEGTPRKRRRSNSVCTENHLCSAYTDLVIELLD